MKRSRFFISMCAASLLVFAGCSSYDPSNDEIGYELSEQYFVSGKITNADGVSSIDGVDVCINGKALAVSDANGNYTISSDSKLKGEISFRKEGYVTVSRDLNMSTLSAEISAMNMSALMTPSNKAVEVSNNNATLKFPGSELTSEVAVWTNKDAFPVNVTSFSATNYVNPDADDFASLRMEPMGVMLEKPITVALQSGLPKGVSFDEPMVIDQASSTKASAGKVLFDEELNAYLFETDKLSDYSFSCNIDITVGPIVTDNKVFQLITVDNACGATKPYNWKQCVDEKFGSQIETNLKLEIKNQFPDFSDSDREMIEKEVRKITIKWMSTVDETYIEEVCKGRIKIQPNTKLIYKSYARSQTTELKFKFKSEGRKINLKVKTVKWLGCRADMKIKACSDHVGGGGY
ncbi:MAG: hypothetical protein ACRCS7_03805 [Tannerellaceae bacterium]